MNFLFGTDPDHTEAPLERVEDVIILGAAAAMEAEKYLAEHPTLLALA